MKNRVAKCYTVYIGGGEIYLVGFLPTEIYDFVYLTYILYHILMSLSTIIFENDRLFLDKTSFPMSYIFNKNNGRGLL